MPCRVIESCTSFTGTCGESFNELRQGSINRASLRLILEPTLNINDMSNTVYIVSAVRTPMGAFKANWPLCPPPDLVPSPSKAP